MASIFDIFTNNVAQQAAQDQIAGLNQGYNLASGAINQGSNILNQQAVNASGQLGTNYTAALQPYLQNYGQATQGTTQLANALGLNGGAAGAQAAAAAYASNPAYQFQLNQGNQNVLRNAAQTGTTASGATLNALQNQGQGLANSTYQQYVQNLMPFLGQANTAASGIGNTYTGLGSGLANISTGLGTQLNANQGSLANLGWQFGTGVGNANANAALAQNQANSNIWNAIGGGISGLASLFSDERLKEDIEPVGELYDGTGVYRYRYIWDDPTMTRIGVMAQEVEQTRPDAVKEIGGYKAVDYGAATDYAAKLAEFSDDNVVQFKPQRRGYADQIADFLEAA